MARQRLDQEAGTLEITATLKATQSQRKDGLADFGKHRSGWGGRYRGSARISTSNGVQDVRPLLPAAFRSSPASSRTKKTPGQRARRVEQGGFTSGRRGIKRIPSFDDDQNKLFVSKT